MFERALMEHPAEIVPSPATDLGEKWWSADGTEVFENGTVYVDGSCTTHGVSELRRASWAAVQVDSNGSVVRRLAGVVPSAWFQTPQVAEHLVMSAMAARLGKAVEIASDCLNVVTQMAKELKE